MDAINDATLSYEVWLLDNLGKAVDKDAFDTKHELMKEGEFPFFRATFYRWAQRWKDEADDLAETLTPRLLSVGDLHVENFGTWRDNEGRLVWGINDFDEACELPWTSDLVRLATSILLAADTYTLPLTPEELCTRVSTAYRRQLALDHLARPFILAEENPELGKLMNISRKEPAGFWNKLRTKKTVITSSVPPSAEASLILVLPEKEVIHQTEWREINPNVDPPGMGSIGRKRFYAVAQWCGAWTAREAKALAPSANAWATRDTSLAIHIGALLENAVRCPDPWFRWYGEWLVRRLAPDAVKADFADLKPKNFDKDAAKSLFDAMGAETANIHLGSGKAATIIQDFDRRIKKNDDWLLDAAKKWRRKLHDDFTAFTL